MIFSENILKWLKSFQVEWGWEEPQAVGETMCFTVYCYQRNGQPYPICDTDELVVDIALGTRKVMIIATNISTHQVKINIFVERRILMPRFVLLQDKTKDK